MKHILAPIAALVLVTTQPLAQEGNRNGVDLMELGAEMIMRGILDELAPAIEELEGLARDLEPALEGFLSEMGPAMAGLMASIDDIGNYEAPVMLENGDILIRRRDTAPPYSIPDDLTPPTPEVPEETDI